MRTGQAKTTLKGAAGPILCVAFSPDDKALVSAGGEESIRLRNVAMGHEIPALQTHAE